MSNKVFEDTERPVREKFQQLMEQGKPSGLEELIDQLQALITEDPDFLEPYLVLDEIYTETGKTDKAAEVVEQAFSRALHLITDDQGNWPDEIPWGVIENRHIVRAILHKAISEWEQRNWQDALDLLRLLLMTNPNDNVAARYYILAIRMGFTFKGFEDRFNKGGYYDSELNEWFDEHVNRFPDEFEWWLKYEF